MISTSRITRLALLGLGAFLFACADSPTGLRTATVIVHLMTPATVASVTVEISGPGLSPPVLVNIPIGADTTARDTLMLTAGSARRVVITAFDSAGVRTHRADTTITLVAGVNPPLAMRLEPLHSTLSITVVFGGVRLTVSDSSRRVVAVSDTMRVVASALTPSGATVPADSLVWGASNPAVFTVAAGLITGMRPDTGTLVVSYGGAAVHVQVRVITPSVASVTLDRASARLVVGSTVQLSATVKDSTGEVLGSRVVTWTSSDPTVATVSTTGLVTAAPYTGDAAVRSAVIQATAEGKSSSLSVDVSKDAATLAAAAINDWYLASTHYEPYMMLQVTADAATANFGNFGMRFNNVEPRVAYSNTTISGDRMVAHRPWTANYGALDAANLVLAILNLGDSGTGGDETEKTRAAALFAQAGSLSNLALLFDRAFVRTEASTGSPVLVPYAVVRDSAMAKWDALIALTESKVWAWNPAWLPTPSTLTASLLGRIANTMAARTLVLSARDASENASTNWTRVLAYAEKGITGPGLTDMDFAVVDDGSMWFDYIKSYGNYHSWTRVDQRVINRMDPDIPVKFNGVANQPETTPNDNRLGLRVGVCASNPETCLVGVTNDYVDLRTTIGDPGRGIYMQSSFYHLRYRNSSFAVPAATRIGQVNPYILAAENDLMIAEALARTGTDLARAASLVNKTHVNRGGRPPVGASVSEILAGVEYERDVELLNTSGLSLFDRRRVDGLQPGTLRHLPIPATVLEALGIPVYTFGGVGLPDR